MRKSTPGMATTRRGITDVTTIVGNEPNPYHTENPCNKKPIPTIDNAQMALPKISSIMARVLFLFKEFLDLIKK
ncbi:MAG: hypothetical protein ACFE9R_21320 [Candidatus Hermodarchaeota archaeon]